MTRAGSVGWTAVWLPLAVPFTVLSKLDTPPGEATPAF